MQRMDLAPLCLVSDVPLNGIKQCDREDGTSICVLNGGDRFFACQAACPHEGIALCHGAFDGDLLTCLEHLWQWSLRSGGDPRGFAEQPLQMFDVRVENGAVYLEPGS